MYPAYAYFPLNAHPELTTSLARPPRYVSGILVLELETWLLNSMCRPSRGLVFELWTARPIYEHGNYLR